MKSITEERSLAKEEHPLLRFLAVIISYLLHPVFTPMAMGLYLAWISPESLRALDESQRIQWLGILIVNTLFFPLLATILMKTLGFINSIQLRTAKDRIIPLIATMIFYFWAYQVFKNLNAPLVFRIFLLGNFWGIILVFLTNIFYKISMHTAAAGGAIGILFVCSIVGKVNVFLPLVVVLFFSGLSGSARMYLRAHKPIEIWLGYFVGILSQIAAYYWFQLDL